MHGLANVYTGLISIDTACLKGMTLGKVKNGYGMGIGWEMAIYIEVVAVLWFEEYTVIKYILH